MMWTMRNTSISYVKTRLVKDIVTNSKAKERSRYQLTDDKDIVDDKTIVFESFGGKNYSDSQNIFMNICNNTTHS